MLKLLPVVVVCEEGSERRLLVVLQVMVTRTWMSREVLPLAPLESLMKRMTRSNLIA